MSAVDLSAAIADIRAAIYTCDNEQAWPAQKALAAVEAALRRAPASAGAVKPLAWEVTGWSSGDGVKGENDDTWEGTMHGRRYPDYTIMWFGGAEFRLEDPDGNKATHPTLDAAKAAAQADYEARILSAIETPVSAWQGIDRTENMQAAYLAGFYASAEGWNAEHPFDGLGTEPFEHDGWCKTRDKALARLDGVDVSAAPPSTKEGGEA